MRWIGRIGLSVLMWAALQQVHAQQVGDTYDKGAQVRIGQYSTQSTKPDASVSEPLDVFVALTFPRKTVMTVGDAIEYTLMRTGWTMDKAVLTPDASAFLNLNLPESQRRMGTYRVRDLLQALLGPTWVWVENPVRRSTWFTLAAAPGKRVQTNTPLQGARP